MIKFKPKNIDRTYISSDSHYFHNKEFVYGDRGFDNPEGHANFIFDQYTSLTGDDTLIFLGDMFLTCNEEEAYHLLDNIKCKVVMCWGNHNAVVKNLYTDSLPSGFKDKMIYPLSLKKYPNIEVVGDLFTLSLSKKESYICSHYAQMTWDTQYKTVKGVICGHSHGSLSGANPEDTHEGKLLDVGVDNCINYNGKAFLSIEEVRTIMSNKPEKQRDHH